MARTNHQRVAGRPAFARRSYRRRGLHRSLSGGNGRSAWARLAIPFLALPPPDVAGGFWSGDVPRADGTTELVLPCGNGQRGGDFELWFWLEPRLEVVILDWGFVVRRSPIVPGPIRGTRDTFADIKTFLEAPFVRF
jgi:hypothetical protein